MRGAVLVLGTDELEEVLLEVEVGRRPVRAVPRRLDGGALADGGARVDHVDRRGARALGPRGAARARRRRRAAVLVLAVAHPPPREGGD